MDLEALTRENGLRGYSKLRNSGVLRPGSLTKIATWVLNGNTSLDYF